MCGRGGLHSVWLDNGDGRDHPTRGKTGKESGLRVLAPPPPTPAPVLGERVHVYCSHDNQTGGRLTFGEHTSGHMAQPGGTLFFDRGLEASSSSRLSPQSRWVGSVLSAAASTLMHGMWAHNKKAHP